MPKYLEPFSEEFGSLFTEFQHTAFRLETLQQYNVEYEQVPFQKYLSGDPCPEDPDKEAWLTLIRNATASGKRMQRVHIVVEPLSDYLRFELSCEYDSNVSAGEYIGLIPTAIHQWPTELPHHDFWLFDAKTLCRMNYSDDGRLLNAEIVDDSSEIVKHNYWRDAALHLAKHIGTI